MVRVLLVFLVVVVPLVSVFGGVCVYLSGGAGVRIGFGVGDMLVVLAFAHVLLVLVLVVLVVLIS